jgi:23S rRNA pseudouridine2605 synthase
MAQDEKRRVGLARALSKSGVCSRSQAAVLILEGKVTVNGVRRMNPEYPVRTPQDQLEVQGARVHGAQMVYLMLNKPRGAVTTRSDEQGRKTVYEFLPDTLSWVAPIGRLDKASEGLLLFSNDSEWSARILAPQTHLPKNYYVQIRGRLKDEDLAAMRQGVRSKQGDILRVDSVSTVRQGERNAWLEIVLEEGKNRHIRRMLEALGFEVLRLIRIAIGPLALGDLAKGKHRELTAQEKLQLDGAMSAMREIRSATSRKVEGKQRSRARR